MSPLTSPLNNKDGYVLVVAMMMLLILTLIGVLASKSTVTELQVSSNDKIQKQSFYESDGGTELAQHLMFHNAICQTTSGGFSANNIGTDIFFDDKSFSTNKEDEDLFTTIEDATRIIAFYPGNVQDDSLPHTNFLNTSRVVFNPGSTVGQVRGYPGNSAVSGTSQGFSIASQHRGVANSESVIHVEWRVNNGVLANATKFDCEY